MRRIILACLLITSALLTVLAISPTSTAEARHFKLVAYMPSWAGDVNTMQYSKLTHVNYAFAIPTSSGGIQAIDNTAKLQSLVSLGHSNGVKVVLSVGGWNNGDDSAFETFAASSTGRTNFVNTMINTVNQYNLDGVDIDWEYPDPGTSGSNYAAMMNQLGTAMHSRGKQLTAAVVAYGSTGDGVPSSVFNDVDYLNLMAYDGDNGAGHSPYSLAQNSINYWRGRGLPASKTVLGVPFYAHPSWATYSDLLAAGCSPDSDTCVYQGATNYYNGRPTMRQKTDLAMQQGGGIMYWEDSQDTRDSRSLLTAIYAEMHSGVTPTSTPVPTGDGTPYTSVSLPGTVQFENFNNGGQGVAYNDAEATNQGGQYRTGDGVDIEATTDTGAGYNVGWTATGEWLKYTVNVSSSGTYTLNFRVASAQAGGTFHLEVDGANVTGTLTVPNTGGWQTWTTVSKTGVNLTAGTRVLRVVMDATGGNFNWFSATTTTVPTNTPVPQATNTPIPSGNGSPYGGTAAALPGTVQIENYNTGGQGVAYNDAEATNQGGQYRTSEGVDIEATTDTGAGYNVGWTAAGEWMKYTVNVTASGTYTLNFRVASAQAGGSFHLEVDGANVTGALTVPNTGGWQTWTTVSKTGVGLSAGSHVLRLVMDAAGGNFNWFSATSGGTAPTNTPAPQATATKTNTPTSGISAWAPNVAYSVGTLVTYSGATYKCLQAHTSQVGWEPPNAPALWQLQ